MAQMASKLTPSVCRATPSTPEREGWGEERVEGERDGGEVRIRMKL